MVLCLTVSGNGLEKENGWEIKYALNGLVAMSLPQAVALFLEAKSQIVKKLTVLYVHELSPYAL